jgi:hypothetical protein
LLGDTQYIFVEKYDTDPWIAINYGNTANNTSFVVYVMDFESGDFGITSSVESDVGDSQAFAQEFIDEGIMGVIDVTNVTAALASDHIADLLGLSG